MSKEFSELEQQLGLDFKDKGLLERALTHRSALAKERKQDYERLEFLGDAVIDLAVAHLLIDRYPDAKEGDLSKMRAALVNTGSLSSVSRKLNLGKFVRLSKGEIVSGGADRQAILEDVFESLMGAIYKDAGFAPAYEFVSRVMDKELADVKPYDPKTELQEALHAAGAGQPSYKLETVEGPEHSPKFVTVVEVGGEIFGRGEGASKKSSQQAAAAEALEKLKK